MKRFDVILEGTTLRGERVESVAAGLGRLLRRDPDFAVRLLRGQRTKVKSGVDEEMGARYIEALRQVGAAACLELKPLEADAVGSNVEGYAVHPPPAKEPAAEPEQATVPECPKCRAKNCEPASAVYKLFIRPEPRLEPTHPTKTEHEATKGQFVSAEERLRIYKAAAPPNSFKRTGILLACAMFVAPLIWFLGLQWFLLLTTLGVAVVVAFWQDSRRSVVERNRWKALVVCMQCGHVFVPEPVDSIGKQREQYYARLRKAEADVSARRWKTFGVAATAVFAILAAGSAIWPQRSKPDAESPRTFSVSPPESVSPARRACDTAERQSSYETQDKIRELAAIEETASGMRYTIYPNSWTVVRPRLAEFVHAIANTDACIEGKARRIDVYGPHGQIVGFADPTIGIRVLP